MKPCKSCHGGSLPFAVTMAFQPVLDLQERRIDAYEALVRGVNGEGAGEVLGQVTPENRYVFDQTCRVKAIELASRLGIACTLNINFLPNAVYEPAACIRQTLDAASRTGFPLSRLTFEIVEQEDMADGHHLRRIIEEYHRIGFKVALDDFGTAYSGLTRMAELRPDIVKLDRALVENCDQSETRRAIIRHMVRLCRELKIKLVVEGVETAGEYYAIAKAGVRFVQGFYFARPLLEAAAAADGISWPAWGTDAEPAVARPARPAWVQA